MSNTSFPPFLKWGKYKTEDKIINDKDDCVICGKLLLEHSEKDANQCYSILTKKQLFKK